MWQWRGIFGICATGPAGEEIACRETAGPGALRLSAGDRNLCFAYETSRALRIRADGLGCRLIYEGNGSAQMNVLPGGRIRINAHGSKFKCMVSVMRGSFRTQVLSDESKGDGTRRMQPVIGLFPDANGVLEAVFDEFLVEWMPYVNGKSFDEIEAEARDDFESWRDKLPAVPDQFAAARDLAAYMLWSNVVEPRGFVSRHAIYMSKNWMTALWSWDHCFNALALAGGLPDAAWDQLMVFFDSQDKCGALADYITPAFSDWGHCKPPVHGWTLARMLEWGDIDTVKLEEAYRPLCRWTDFWMTCRDDDNDGIPNYLHGNDSGWDNATVFDADANIETPDLSAYLVLQMDTLSDIARRLGKTGEAEDWRRRADRLLEAFLAHSYKDGAFVSLQSGTHASAGGPFCLMNCMPIVLGERLPSDVRQSLVDRLGEGGDFLTQYGYASESPKSPLYAPDGYWRGPIWPPTTLLIIDGLWRAGAKDLARTAARRYIEMCGRSGFSENHDALTGAPLRDPAYTWTASVFLVLASRYL
jgi:glycogen debranching enzyme